MELKRRDFCVMICCDFIRRLKQEECLKQLVEAFSDAAPYRETVFRWFAEFRESLKDDSNPGRPPTAVLSETISDVEKMSKRDDRMMYIRMQERINIGATALSTILHEHLKVRKVLARWVPYPLTQEQKEHGLNWWQFMLEKFDHGKSKQVYDIVTANDSWVFINLTRSKTPSSVWIFPDEQPSQKLKGVRSVGENDCMFLWEHGPCS